MIRWNGITVKLLLAFFAILVISFSITSGISYWFVRSELGHRNFRFEKEQIQVASAIIKSAYNENWDPRMLRSALQMASGPNRTLYVLDAAGRVVLQSGAPGSGSSSFPSSAREAIQGVLDKGETVIAVPIEGSGSPSLSAVPVNGTAGTEARAVAIVTRDFKRDFSVFAGLFRNIMLSTLITSIVIVFFVSRRMTARLRRMRDAASLIAKGNFDIRLNARPRDEIGELAESLNRMSEDLGGLDRMRREFLANVSHDLRSPLTSIGGYVEAMIDGAVPDERRGDYLSLIRSQTQRMNRLVGDLLEVARIEAGQLEIHPVAYNLTEWIRRLLAGLDPEFARRSLRFELTGDPEDVWVIADPNRIDQVLSNLLLNAIQFTPNGKKVEVSIERRDRTAVVSVRDEGVGIPGEQLDRIWQRFYKSDKARSAHSGSGLGLSIVQNVLAKHGTKARVESAPGAGSTFSFELPIASPPTGGRSPIARQGSMEDSIG